MPLGFFSPLKVATELRMQDSDGPESSESSGNVEDDKCVFPGVVGLVPATPRCSGVLAAVVVGVPSLVDSRLPSINEQHDRGDVTHGSHRRAVDEESDDASRVPRTREGRVSWFPAHPNMNALNSYYKHNYHFRLDLTHNGLSVKLDDSPLGGPEVALFCKVSVQS